MLLLEPDQQTRPPKMRIYLPSLVTGVLVGVIYSLLNVRSPAPFLVALVGLLGILIGEQVNPDREASRCRNFAGPCLAASETRFAHVWHAAWPPRRRGSHND
jgi:XapX domain-containing protein